MQWKSLTNIEYSFFILADITGNRHNLYNQPPQLAVVTAPPSKDLPSNFPKHVAPSNDDPNNTRYQVQSVTKKISKSNDAKGTMYGQYTETTMASKKTSYSEKVALIAKESTFAKDGHDEDDDKDIIDNDIGIPKEPSSTAMVSVDDEPSQEDDDVVQGEVVSSQIITSRYSFCYASII